ncbi:hypothetical protein ACEPAG_4997 [Sanghuangporus baumii]
MPATKLKAQASKSRKSSTNEKAEPSSASRRKPRRKVVSDEDEDDYESPPESEEEEEDIEPGTSGQLSCPVAACRDRWLKLFDPITEQHAQRRPSLRRRRSSMSQSNAPDPDKLFEVDENVDVINRSPQNDMMDIDIPDRAPTPVPGPFSRRRSFKKKVTAIYSDEDDDYVDAGRKQEDKDDEDFVVEDSPPVRKSATGRKGAKGRGKGAKEKGGGFGEIMIKDERKLPASAGAPSGTAGDAKAGTKRRRETVSEANAPPDTQPGPTGVPAQSSSTAPAQASQPKDGASSVLPPFKIRKLPPIKKNKNLAGVTSTTPSSGVSTPSVSAPAPAASINTTNPSDLPLHTSLPRKPPAPKTSDVDLTSPDIYNSLFKTGAPTARAGSDSRVKELARRRELMKMRDEARAVRMANLQKKTFNLLGPQDKVARFEAKLRARNSPAVYPNHLGSALKLIAHDRNNGMPVRPFKRNSGNEGEAAAMITATATATAMVGSWNAVGNMNGAPGSSRTGNRKGTGW